MVLCVFFSPRYPFSQVVRDTRYKLGESFLHLSQPKALARLEVDQTAVSAQLAEFNHVAKECESGMKDLKVRLYAKFGRAINLDE